MEKKQKVLIGVLVGIIIVLTIVCVYLLLNQKDDTNAINGLHYEIKEDSSGSYPRSLLYINGKLFNQIDWDMYEEDKVHQIDDILMVEVCTSNCEVYFINKNASVIGSIGNVDRVKTKSLISPKFENYTVKRIDNKDIYLESINFTYQDGSSLCEFKDNDVVKAEEKFTYLGNETFSSSSIVSSKTAKEILKSDTRFSCE